MSDEKQVEPDPTKPVELNITCTSPHVLAYKLWYREPGGDWQVIGQGTTSDDKPDFYRTGPHPAGTELVYQFRFGGNPRTFYRGLMTVGQGGQTLPSGTVIEDGWTDDDGLVAIQRTIRLG